MNEQIQQLGAKNLFPATLVVVTGLIILILILPLFVVLSALIQESEEGSHPRAEALQYNEGKIPPV